jgi:hypothetical protein
MPAFFEKYFFSNPNWNYVAAGFSLRGWGLKNWETRQNIYIYKSKLKLYSI